MSEARRVEWIVYILHCKDGSYYVGHTQDLDQRIEAHDAGVGATWTRNRRPVRLVYHESHDSKPSAVQREAQIKKWSRAKKAALISDDKIRLRRLSASRSSQHS